jgi:hypothetical protein
LGHEYQILRIVTDPPLKCRALASDRLGFAALPQRALAASATYGGRRS